MENCIFCQIVAGKSPCYKVYEDDNFLAFLDTSPRVKGHTLVIPKKHFQWVYDVLEFNQYWQTVLKITKAIQRSLKPDFVSYSTYGLEVAHAHIHILPHQNMLKGEIWPAVKRFSVEEMERIAKNFSQEVTRLDSDK